MEPQLTKTGLKGESVGLPCLITDGQQQKDNFVLEWFKDSTQVFSIFSGSDKGHPAEILKGNQDS